MKERLLNQRDLTDDDENTLNVWNDTSPDFVDLEKPKLPKFREALNNLIYEQTHSYDEVEEEEQNST